MYEKEGGDLLSRYLRRDSGSTTGGDKGTMQLSTLSYSSFADFRHHRIIQAS
jgi:hypothetical protein